MAGPNFFDQFDEPASDGGSGPLVVTVRPGRKPVEAAGGNFFDQFDDTATGELSTNNVGRAFARGVPIIGGALNKMNAATNAFLDPLIPDAVVSAIGGKRIPGSTFAERYENELRGQNEADAEFERQNPITAKGTEIAGGVAGTIPMVLAAPAAFGISKSPMAINALKSTATGAAIGGTDSAVRSGGDRGQAWRGALVGGGFGAASPYIGAGFGRLAEWVRNSLRGRSAGPMPVSPRAADMLAQDFEAAGGAPMIQRRMQELGQDAMLLDASPGLMGRAQGLAVQPETRDAVMTPLIQRQAGANARLRSDVDATVGPAPTPSRIEAGLAQSRDAAAEGYAPVMRDAVATNTRALADRLETAAVNLRGPEQRAVRDVRQMLDISGAPGQLDPSPQALHSVREAIDGLLQNEKNGKVIRQLTNARRQVDEALAEAAPGIKAVDARVHELFRQSEGLASGQRILDSGRTAMRPDELADDLTRAVAPQGEMVGPSGEAFRMRQGLRADIDREIGTKANDLVALRNVVKGDGDWNRSKLAQVFGDSEADRIIGAVDREAAFNDAYRKIVENSQTAMRTEGAAAMKPRAAGEGAGSLNDVGTGLSAVAGGAPAVALNLGVRGVRLSANQIERAAELARNQELAVALTRGAGPELDLLVRTIENRIGLKVAGETVKERAKLLAQILTQAQGSRGSENLPASWGGR